MIDVFQTKWADAITLELACAEIIREQINTGWLLDKDLCVKHIEKLNALIAETDREILPLTKPRIIRDSEIDSPFRKDGHLSERVRRYFGESATSFVKGPFTKLSFETINLGSSIQVKDYLFSIGWEPDEWNEDDYGNRTSPKLTTTSLLKLGKPGELLDHRTVLTHRRNQLEGFLRNVREDGRIEARANTLGTPTMRMTHSVVVNVPKADPKVFFGKEMRSVFTVPEDCVLVGGDIAGLENRCIVHYLNNPDLIKVFTEGDFHMKFMEVNKQFLKDRNTTKTVEYAFFFEAKDWKLGTLVDDRCGLRPEDVGAQIRKNVETLIPGLTGLISKTQKEAEQGWVLGIDGRKIRIRRSPFNSKIQSAGAIFFKRVIFILDKWLKDARLCGPVKLLGVFHDEAQYQVKKEYAIFFKSMFEIAVKEAAKYYKFRCPMEGNVKIGRTWAETH